MRAPRSVPLRMPSTWPGDTWCGSTDVWRGSSGIGRVQVWMMIVPDARFGLELLLHCNEAVFG